MKQKPTNMNTKKFNRKQLRAALALLCIVGGSLAAMSFTSSPGESTAKTGTKAGANYFWYDPETGDQLSLSSSPTSPNGCPDTGSVRCAIGFSAPSNDPLNSTPDQTEYKGN